MDKNDLAALLIDAPAAEVDQIHRLLHEWSVGPDSSFPVQMSLLTKAQWRIAANLPRLMNDSRKLIELHLAEYRRQTAELVKNLSAVGEDQADEFKNVVKAHTEALNQASGSFRSQLKSVGAFTQDIRKHLDDGVSSYNHIKTDLKVGREMFLKTCEDFDVAKRLRLGLRQIFAPAFVFDDELAAPEQVNGVDVALKIADVGLERGDGRAADAEHVEEFVVKSLFVGTLRGRVAPITGETNRTVAHLAPREMWHGCSSARESACCVVTVLCGNSGA
jgi:hypothetical protein